jgi:N-acetylmuramate 1-kinase
MIQATPTQTDPRAVALHTFIAQQQPLYGLDINTLTPASADASFRRYFRIRGTQSLSYIVMDAPPEHENCQPFIAVAQLFTIADLNLPTVLAQDLTQGFLLLKDLGSTTYLNALQSGADHRPLYADAITALVKLQAASLKSPEKCSALPPYDADKLQQEMSLFDTWFLNKHHGITLNEREAALLKVAFHLITQACTAQLSVWVHRDYHCRNLMKTEQNNPGVLDFQDALSGAYTYDLVSLLRDAYIDWPVEAQIELALQYWQQARAAGIAVPEDFGQLWRDFEWMGLQRHLKVLGIFARLSHRDGKDGYLNDLPVVLKYAQAVAQRYDGLGVLVRLFDRVQGVERQVGVTF